MPKMEVKEEEEVEGEGEEMGLLSEKTTGGVFSNLGRGQQNQLKDNLIVT
jgi:hypothetical protein